MTTKNLTVQPLRFQPSFEVVPDDEAQTSKELVEAMHSILETTLQDTGHAIRSVHAKAHGLLRGQIQVYDDLPEPLAQGAFAKPGNFPLFMRLSTNPGDILDDKVSTPRGLAIKLVGIEGTRLPGSADASTQDFVMQNAKAFTARDPKAFFENLEVIGQNN